MDKLIKLKPTAELSDNKANEENALVLKGPDLLLQGQICTLDENDSSVSS